MTKLARPSFRIFAQMLCGSVLLAATNERLVAGNETWKATPGSGDWNTVSNWIGGTVPHSSTDTATFGVSNVTGISLSVDTQASGIVFNSGASNFTITATPNISLTLLGGGITNNSGTIQNFVVNGSGGGNVGTLGFLNGATAGANTAFAIDGAATSTSSGGHVFFYNNASAGSGSFSINSGAVTGANGGQISFAGHSTAGSGSFTNRSAAALGARGGKVLFYDSATAGNANFINNGDSVNTSGGDSAGFVIFSDTATAGQASLTNNGGTPGGGQGGYTMFLGNATAGGATIVANGGSASGGGGGKIYFEVSSSAGDATLIANGGTAGGYGGEIYFYGDTSGGTARVELFGSDSEVYKGVLDISVHNAGGIGVGSIEGNGLVFLGGRSLTTGANNMSTTFSGELYDSGLGGGTGGSLTKIGSGVLTLSGASMYTGGTTISGGTVRANNASGSAFGSGTVTVTAGATLGGTGFVGGATTIAGGAHLAPGNSPGTLTFTNGLTLASGAILDFQLGNLGDHVAVTGGTLIGPSGNGGLTLNLSDAGGFAPGVSYTLFDFVSGQASGFDVVDFSLGTLIGSTVASDYSFTLTATALALTYNGSGSAIPEPATYGVLLGLAALGCAVFRHRLRNL